MATYQEDKFLTKIKNDAFDKDHEPGTDAPRAGIYRCMGCHREVGIATSHKLPPQNHHEHSEQQGKIRWRLVAYADHNPK